MEWLSAMMTYAIKYNILFQKTSVCNDMECQLKKYEMIKSCNPV